MAWVYYLLMLLVLLVGWAANILGLPGLWLMVAGYGLYGWITGWDVHVGWPSLITIVVLAVLAEVVEFLAGAAGSASAGGRKRGMIGAIVGGFLGAIFLSVIPIPVVAQVIGACLGAFIGAAVMEFTDKDAMHALRVGVGAAKGRFYGIVSKLAFGGLMFVVALVAGMPVGAVPITPPVLPPPAAQPPLLPSTMPTIEPATAPAAAPTSAPATLPSP
jgi:uncharacterized protein YqgC (DUF456 family)